MAKLYTDFFARRFVTPYCSMIYLLSLIIWLCIVILPIVISTSTYGFWKRIDYFTTQPHVKYTNQFYAVANVGNKVQAYSTVKAINDQISNGFDSPTVSVTKIDHNYD